MPVRPIPEHVDTVVVGNGPSALLLSFILHGNIPYYNTSSPHPDPILHKKLSRSPCLLDIDVDDLTAHFAASRLSYSTQALPINVLLDTLIRPLADIAPENHGTCLEWRLESANKVPHIVLGNTAQPGGQWADNPVSASWDIGTLSYADMLSLPKYTFEDHFKSLRGTSVPEFYRPTRREVARYLAAYPEKVGIEDCVYSNVQVAGVRRFEDGFLIGSHNLTCRHLVLASGTFSNLIPPRSLLRPLNALPRPNTKSDAPLLVVGSGFTAADVIISTPPNRKIVHIFKWDAEGHPSPLRACHPRAYPEYATVYRNMKIAAKNMLGPARVTSPTRIKNMNPFVADRDWANVYEGLPNTYIKDIMLHGSEAILTLETGRGKIKERNISNMDYVIGRRGSLCYLDETIAEEVFRLSDHPPNTHLAISGRTLRPSVERSLELAPNIFAIGSLTGDSLIRFAGGGCVFAAREIMIRTKAKTGQSGDILNNLSRKSLHPNFSSRYEQSVTSPMAVITNGHSDLHLDRAMRSLSIDQEISKFELWREPDWWAGGCSVT